MLNVTDGFKQAFLADNARKDIDIVLREPTFQRLILINFWQTVVAILQIMGLNILCRLLLYRLRRTTPNKT